jgi:hypothetical protein
MVGRALKLKLAAPREIDNGNIVVCQYSPASGGKGAIVRLAPQSDPTTFAAGKKAFVNGMGAGMKMKVTKVPGFVDEAYTSTMRAGLGVKTTTLVARSGSLEVLVSADATLAQEKSLLTAIFAAS